MQCGPVVDPAAVRGEVVSAPAVMWLCQRGEPCQWAVVCLEILWWRGRWRRELIGAVGVLAPVQQLWRGCVARVRVRPAALTMLAWLGWWWRDLWVNAAAVGAGRAAASRAKADPRAVWPLPLGGPPRIRRGAHRALKLDAPVAATGSLSQ